MRVRSRLNSMGSARCTELILATGSDPAQHHLSIVQTILLHQLIERSSICRRNAYATMGDGLAKILHVIAAMDSVPIFHKENGMRYGSTVPLLTVPSFIHRGGRVGPDGVE